MYHYPQTVEHIETKYLKHIQSPTFTVLVWWYVLHNSMSGAGLGRFLCSPSYLWRIFSCLKRSVLPLSLYYNFLVCTVQVHFYLNDLNLKMPKEYIEIMPKQAADQSWGNIQCVICYFYIIKLMSINKYFNNYISL